MNKIVKIRFILALSLCFVCITSFAFSQVENKCLGPCRNYPWNSDQATIEYYCPNKLTACNFTYFYEYRNWWCYETNDFVREFRITGIVIEKESENEENCYCFKHYAEWTNPDVKELLELAIKDFLFHSILLFGQQNEEEFTVTYRSESCWSHWDGYLQIDFFPCNYTNCCVYEYLIFVHKQGYGDNQIPRVKEVTNLTGDTYLCVNESGQQCLNVCDVHVDEDTYLTPKIIIKHELNEEKSINSIRVIPNPVKNSMVFNINDKHLIGSAKLEIFNENGVLIISKSFNKSESSIDLNIDFLKHSKGVYLYQIEFENNKVFNGKFIKE